MGMGALQAKYSSFPLHRSDFGIAAYCNHSSLIPKSQFGQDKQHGQRSKGTAKARSQGRRQERSKESAEGECRRSNNQVQDLLPNVPRHHQAACSRRACEEQAQQNARRLLLSERKSATGQSMQT